MKRTSLGLTLVAFGLANAQDRSPLGEFRKAFLNQRITVNQGRTPIPSLLDWNFVKEKKGVYTVDHGKEVPSAFAGQSGTIVGVFAPSRVFEAPSPQTDDTYVQYAEAVVRLDSGQLIETTLFSPKTGHDVDDSFTLASARAQHKQEAFALAQKLSGKSLYLTRMTRIYDMSLTIAAIPSVRAGISSYSEAEINDVPLLTPLPVIESRYSDKLDFSLITLQLPNGEKAQYVPGCVVDELTAQKYGCAATSMPTFLTDHEIEAIRARSVFVGMSEPALYMAIDVPKETNRSVVGSTQLVYAGEYIYIQGGRVIEIQSHN